MSADLRVLVATDLSASASWAEDRAARLAAQRAGSLDMLHVVSTTPLAALQRLATGIDIGHAGDLASKQLDESARDLAARWSIAVRARLANGSPAAEILREAEALRPDVLVAGAHGAHFVHELLFGSTAERLLYRANVPLLVVKRRPQQAYSTVLLAVDFSSASCAAVRAARALLPGAAMTLYHAVEAMEESFASFALDEPRRAQLRAIAIHQAEGEMAQFVGRCGAETIAPRVEYGYPPAMIEAALSRSAFDLLVLGKRGRSALEHWMVGSVTAHLVRSVSCDVLVVPDERPYSALTAMGEER